MRLRLAGGRTTADALAALLWVSRRHGDGDVHLTARANLQLRALPFDPADESERRLRPDVSAAIAATGMVPSESHELVRNLMLSPASGVSEGRADLRPVLSDLDNRICADPGLTSLPGRFLMVLDDGCGDLVERPCDLGLVALGADEAQLRVGSAGWGPVVPLGEAVPMLITLAHRFLDVRGSGPTAPWHVDELSEPLVAPVERDARVPAPTAPLAYGPGPAGEHLEVPGGRLDQDLGQQLVRMGDDLVVTPWHGVLVPGSA